jgi:hypothetical protein
MTKLIGIACTTGRDKFRDDRGDEINDLAKTLTGGNAGGKFRKAEAVLWQREEDRAKWDAMASSTENVDWEE